jgi:putative transposase
MHESKVTACDGIVDRSQKALRQQHSHSVLIAHVVWATRDRQSVLVSDADAWLTRFFRSKAEELGARVMASGNADDHVHLVLHYPATRSLAEIVHRLKGASSHEWNVELASRYGRLAWRVGYWAESVSPGSLAPLVHYVNRQREHHGAGSTSPKWEPSPSPRTPHPARLRSPQPLNEPAPAKPGLRG